MEVTAYKTHKIQPGENINSILDFYLPKIKDGSVVAVTSKIVSICEKRIVALDEKADKRILIHAEADKYLEDPKYFDKYHISLTIKDSNLIASSGIDESNGNGYYILWPKNPYKSSRDIWNYLRNKYQLKHLGVIITDSHTTPLRWGVTGTTLSWCGFNPLNDYTGKPDIYGRLFKFEKTNVIDSLATCATLIMGEGNEQTPLAVLDNLPFIEFKDNPPTLKEIASLKISLNDDIYAPLLMGVPWKSTHKS
jgi:dihydrofolate synthase / folylpolyglutamate synthase